MKTFQLLLTCLSFFYPVFLTEAQGTFQNLGFESANLTPVPSGQYGSSVPIEDALPGWKGYLGTNQITTVLQNSFTLGSASIDILGPDWSSGNIIDGQYTVMLQAGVDTLTGSGLISAAISQTSLIPVTAQSIQFKTGPAGPAGQFQLTLAGQNIPLVAILGTPDYMLYGGDISAFSGQTEELRISALPGNSFFALDSIVFSDQPIPEPGTFALVALGSMLLAFPRWRSR